MRPRFNFSLQSRTPQITDRGSHALITRSAAGFSHSTYRMKRHSVCSSVDWPSRCLRCTLQHTYICPTVCLHPRKHKWITKALIWGNGGLFLHCRFPIYFVVFALVKPVLFSTSLCQQAQHVVRLHQELFGTRQPSFILPSCFSVKQTCRVYGIGR